jgi:hypothetical protein
MSVGMSHLFPDAIQFRKRTHLKTRTAVRKTSLRRTSEVAGPDPTMRAPHPGAAKIALQKKIAKLAYALWQNAAVPTDHPKSIGQRQSASYVNVPKTSPVDEHVSNNPGLRDCLRVRPSFPNSGGFCNYKVARLVRRTSIRVATSSRICVP